LLAHFDSEELVVSLIDLHEESLECIKSMLEHFGFLTRVRQMVCGDATVVELESSADVVLTETMNAALSQEPQVTISRALIRQHPDAILIPQSIRIDCVLLDIAKETSQFPPRIDKRMILGTVFELSRKSAIDLKEKDGLLPAARIRIPDHAKPGVAPWLATTIQVFNDSRFSDYETQISLPVPLDPDGGRSVLGATLQFAYQLGEAPGFVFQIA
jgi:hypothetical protein